MKSRRKTQLLCYPLKFVKDLEHGRWGSMLTTKAKKMGKNILANWRGKPYLGMAKDKPNLPENGEKHLVSPMNFLKQFQSQLNVLESQLEMKVLDWLMQSVVKISHKCTTLL